MAGYIPFSIYILWDGLRTAQRLVKPRFGVLELLFFYWNDVTVIKSLEDTWALPSLFW